MLEEITGVTESGAEGIAEQWKSFRNLMEAYERMERRKEKGEIGQKDIEHMLANCVVCIRCWSYGACELTYDVYVLG